MAVDEVGGMPKRLLKSFELTRDLGGNLDPAALFGAERILSASDAIPLVLLSVRR